MGPSSVEENREGTDGEGFEPARVIFCGVRRDIRPPGAMCSQVFCRDPRWRRTWGSERRPGVKACQLRLLFRGLKVPAASVVSFSLLSCSARLNA